MGDRRVRRWRSAAEKRRIVELTLVPGASVALVALRSRIVLLAAEGKQHKQISEELKISPRMAALWRRRFLLLGVEGLLKDGLFR